jgi:hypothetical protein
MAAGGGGTAVDAASSVGGTGCGLDALPVDAPRASGPGHRAPALATFGMAEREEEDCYDMVSASYDPHKFVPGVSEYDVSCAGNVLAAPEYVTDIIQRLYDLEVRQRT